MLSRKSKRWIASKRRSTSFNIHPYSMAQNEITFDMVDSQGRPAEQAMARIIEARKRELGETTESACIALAINILKSLRADTKLAKLKANIKVEDVTGEYHPSFQREKGAKGKKKSQRVLRSGGKNGSVVNPEKVIWLCGHYHKGEQLHTYRVVDEISQDLQVEYLMVAENAKLALNRAKKYHENKVKRTRGLAKYVLGMCAHYVHNKENPKDKVTQEAKETGMQNAQVTVNTQGIDSGTVSIHIHDKLDYAALALKSGENALTLAAQRALNSMTAYINKRWERKGIQDKLDIPFRDMVN